MAGPRSDWWKIISGASKEVEPDIGFRAAKSLALAQQEDSTLQGWPAHLYEAKADLPGISDDEALAILYQFLLVETKRLQPGVYLYHLQWDVLSAMYCPERERINALRSLTGRGMLLEGGTAPKNIYKGLRWPITITQEAISAITLLRIRSKYSALAIVERWLTGISEAYPTSLRVLIWILLGGVLTNLVQYLYGLIKD